MYIYIYIICVRVVCVCVCVCVCVLQFKGWERKQFVRPLQKPFYACLCFSNH